MERFRQRYGIALTKKKLQEIILMLMAWEADRKSTRLNSSH